MRLTYPQGVLTKPDTLTKGATGGREKWKAVLEGREHRTKHGYYCVRLPDDDERARKVSRMKSQRIADDFFTSTPPWSEMSDRRCFGIPNFVHDISALLVQLIEKKYVHFYQPSYLLLTTILAVFHRCARLLNPNF